MFKPYGHHSIAITNRESCSKRHANSDIDLRANAEANNRAIASPYDCFANCCFAAHFDASPCKRNADANP